ncbi:hypothetical protein CPB86DRAFT_285996 [Serendipita vermifera]|nr:hypothetical protein CPB86DRAFT_285996 [Serendipita vermifera]
MENNNCRIIDPKLASIAGIVPNHQSDIRQEHVTKPMETGTDHIGQLGFICSSAKTTRNGENSTGSTTSPASMPLHSFTLPPTAVLLRAQFISGSVSIHPIFCSKADFRMSEEVMAATPSQSYFPAPRLNYTALKVPDRVMKDIDLLRCLLHDKWIDDPMSVLYQQLLRNCTDFIRNPLSLFYCTFKGKKRPTSSQHHNDNLFPLY